eukprot:TRINITY_DN5809_c0_g1_i2.p1 TRINITY_DN5809_c0_g1~~TRINITY_DN5809_c0_g1_i2.p1  ORF type:complete len:164 (+),score=15.92 TRINITY_DN5809_c0_g1_i2:436-927(+)
MNQHFNSIFLTQQCVSAKKSHEILIHLLIDSLIVPFMHDDRVHMLVMVAQLLAFYGALSETIYIKNQMYSQLLIEFRPLFILYTLYFATLVVLKAVRLTSIFLMGYPRPLLWNTWFYPFVFYIHHFVVVLYEYHMYLSILELYNTKHYAVPQTTLRNVRVITS